MVHFFIRKFNDHKQAICLIAACGYFAATEVRVQAELQIEGDPKLLRLVSMAHKSNKEKILTWQGTALIQESGRYAKDQFKDTEGEGLTDRWTTSSASFATDIMQNVTR